MTEITVPNAPQLTAYVVGDAALMPLLPAARVRAWMEGTHERFANRCLPLLIANQAGWWLVGAHTLRATWDGRMAPDALTVECLEGKPPGPAVSHFGHGILTWHVPYLFRTSSGYNLLVRGPANWPKDGAAALEGLVESDWSAATFTINWQITRPHHPVTFEKGEPIAMLVPQRRGELDLFHVGQRPLADDPELARGYFDWSSRRGTFNAELKVPGSEATRQRWQKEYFQGRAPDGSPVREHQTKLILRSFEAGGGGSPAGVEAAPESAAAPDELVVEEGFVDAETCAALIALHRRRVELGERSQNGYVLSRARTEDPDGYRLAQTVVRRLTAFVGARSPVPSAEPLGCDLAMLCGQTDGFSHPLHADNTVVVCPRHGAEAEALRRAGCRCPDVELRPNHTPWRQRAAMLYLSSDHRGGDIVFGDGPNRFGGRYRRQIRARAGLLVLSPCDERFFHHTTPVEHGVRYSLNSWFTTDRLRQAEDWA
jgi:hypothetical protein